MLMIEGVYKDSRYIDIKNVVMEILRDDEARAVIHIILVPIFIFLLGFKSAIGAMFYIIAYSIIVFQKKDNESQRVIVRGSLIGYSGLIALIGLLVLM